MLARPDERVYAALARLRLDPDFQVVLEWISASEAVLQKQSASHKDEVLLRWNQGALQCMADFGKQVMEAPAATQKLRRV